MIKIISIKSKSDAIKELRKIGCDDAGIKIMAEKALFYTIKLFNLSAPAANIMKQEMLALGGDAAIARATICNLTSATDVLLMGTLKQYKLLCKKLAKQPFGLNKCSKEILHILREKEKK